MNEIIEGEAREVQAMAVRTGGSVGLPIPVEQAIKDWEDYQELTRRLLNETDYQVNGRERFKKKSAWRKYAKAFNIDDHVAYEHIERAPDGWPIWARVRVQATAPNGRTTEADHECHTSERCCAAAQGGPCRKKGWSSHTCCLPGCTGRSHWSHPGDVAATALTRAKNRAISDLIGAGEVSAEEITRDAPETAPEPNREMKPQPANAMVETVDDPLYVKLLERYGEAGAAKVIPGGFALPELPCSKAAVIAAGSALKAALDAAKKVA